MKIWLHRISHHAETSYPLIEKGFLTIGFVDFANSEFIQRTESEGWSYFNSKFEKMWNSTPRTRHNLWRFIHEMKQGDWVVVPSSGEFSIYKIDDNSAQPIGEINVDNLKTWGN